MMLQVELDGFSVVSTADTMFNEFFTNDDPVPSEDAYGFYGENGTNPYGGTEDFFTLFKSISSLFDSSGINSSLVSTDYLAEIESIKFFFFMKNPPTSGGTQNPIYIHWRNLYTDGVLSITNPVQNGISFSPFTGSTVSHLGVLALIDFDKLNTPPAPVVNPTVGSGWQNEVLINSDTVSSLGNNFYSVTIPTSKFTEYYNMMVNDSVVTEERLVGSKYLKQGVEHSVTVRIPATGISDRIIFSGMEITLKGNVGL